MGSNPAQGKLSFKHLLLIYIYIYIYIYIGMSKSQSKSGISQVLFLKQVVSYQFIPKLSIFKASCYLFCLFFVCLLACIFQVTKRNQLNNKRHFRSLKEMEYLLANIIFMFFHGLFISCLYASDYVTLLNITWTRD